MFWLVSTGERHEVAISMHNCNDTRHEAGGAVSVSTDELRGSLMKLAQSLNRTMLVSVPGFFGDNEARACTLVDVEDTGLWLACDELKDRIGQAHEISAAWNMPVIGFFPFAQILYVVDPSQFAALARPAPARLARPAAPAVTDVPGEHAPPVRRPKQKSPKARR